MNRLALFSAAILPALFAANAYGAVEVEFDFRGNQGIQNSLNFSNEGIDVTVQGFLTDAESPIPVKVHQDNRRGLSVVNTTTDDTDDDLNAWNRFGVDGRGDPEFIQLTFSRPVGITSLDFGSIGSFDTFGLSVDGSPVDLVGLLGTNYIRSLPDSNSSVDLSSLGLKGSELRLSANTYGLTDDGLLALDDWQLKKIDVQHMPEPASVVIWATLGLGFVLLRARRHRKVAK